ncbi:hypothetical protein ACPB9J_15870 [Streptomyces lavendulocolor]|uniref:hypothetical protein n=1 Tax=Streptomyces lavendulocolor TaxID=67316 RepID=UPI003C2BA6E3
MSTPRAKGGKPGTRTDRAQVDVTFSPYIIRRHREELSSWVQANGLNADVIPLDHPIQVEEGEGGPVIRYRAYLLDDDGRAQSDRFESGELLTEERTTPCTVPPPDLGASASVPASQVEAGPEAEVEA